MSAAHEPAGCPLSWPTPFWRHMRAQALIESNALRAYARAGMKPPPTRPVDLLAEYRPRQDWRKNAPTIGQFARDERAS